MATTPLQCWNCGYELADVPLPLSRHEQCPACFEALHCCRFCRHYRIDVTGQCDDERADPPVIKENANFCDFFQPNRNAFDGARSDRGGAARDKLEALFGASDPEAAASEPDAAEESDEGTQTPEEAARAKLDDLFSKD
ncbi:MAG: hypothetical protein AAGE43_09485 [Pseudomonadota bacterium]